MDHYFSSIAKHLTDGSGGAGGGGQNPGQMNGNATPRGSQGQQQMMMAAMQQQQQQQQQQGGQMGQMGGNIQGNNMMPSGFPGPLQGLPGSRQSSVTSQRQMSQGQNVMPSGLPGPLQGLPGGGSAGGRQGSIGSRQGSVGLQQAMGRQSSGGNSQQSQQSQQQQLQIMQQQQAMQQQQIQQEQRSSISSANNPYTSKELLTMLDDDLQESNQTRGNGGQPQTQQQSQQQMMMMQAAMMNRQKQMQDASQGGQMSQQHQQQVLNAAQQRQAELQAQLQRQAQAQQQQAQQQAQQQQAQQQAQQNQQQQQQQGMNQQGAAHGPGQGQQQPPASAQTQMSQQKQQIHNFLQLHGHQLTQQQRLSLQQQLSALQQQAGGSGMSASGGSGGQNQSQMGSGGQQSDMRQGNAVMIQPPPQAPPVTDAAALTANSAQMANAAAMAAMAQAMGQDPNNPVLNMDAIMVRQRDQLKHLQTMLKGATDPEKAAMLQAQHAMLQQAMLQRHLEQQMHQQQGGGGQGRQPSASSVVMQQMLLAAAQQQREESISPVPIGPTKAFPKHVQSQGTHQKAVASSAGPLPAAVGSAGGGSAPARTTTRVVPVSISPFAAPGEAKGESSEGGVSDAALIYTKCALRSIIASLNNGAKAKSGGPLAREYTVRDLSTCLGAWDLNVPKSPGGSKRQKLDDGKSSSSESDGNAETAFQFYYERSCPILLDAKHDSAPVPFYVEDFGNNAIEGTSDDSLPVVVGAVVLTYGADEKFTGGIGEEGVLTKAIVEFFCEEAALSSNTSEDALAEAEERMFARVDPAEERSGSLIQASLYALSPNVVASEPPPSSSSSADSSDKDSATGTSSLDDGVYIPTIWSGNTDRVYQYCLLGNFDDNGRERKSKRLCVAIQKKRKEDQCQVGGGDKGPAKGVCRITLTLSPQSVQAKKKQMAKEREDGVERHSSSEVHRKIRKNLRILRPPKLTAVSGPDIQPLGGKRRRQALRRRSVTQMIDHTKIVVGVRCKHELLLDADEVGKIYVNGTLLADCSSSTRDSSKGILGADALPSHTLFGVDFTLPSSSAEKTITIKSELPGKLVLEREYGALLVDALIAGQVDADVGGKLLGRLISGSTEQPDGFDLSEDDVRYHDQLPRTENCCSIKFDDVSRPCLESIVLSSSMADPVGIGAKALGTRFRVQYGKEAFPFEVGSYDECRIPRVLGAQKIAVPVPRRAREVLYRGAYLPLDKMAQFLWAGAGGVSSTSWDGDHGDAMRAAEAMEGAIQLLRKSGCKDVQPNKVKFVAKKKLEPTGTAGNDDASTTSSKCAPSVSKLRCWYDSGSGSYYVSDGFLFVEEGEGAEEEESGASGSSAGPSARNESKAQAAELVQTNPPPSSEKKDVPTERSGEAETKLPESEADGKESEAAAEKENDGEPKAEGDEDSKEKAESAEGKADDTTEKSSDSKPEIPDDDSMVAKEPKETVADEAKDNTTSSSPAKPDDTPKEPAGEKKQTTPKHASAKHASAKDAAYRLAFYIAKEHPDAAVLERFVMCHRS